MSYDNQRRKYSLDGGSGKAPAAPAPAKAPAAPPKPVSTSTFLTRIANTAIRESGGSAPAANARPNWMAVDHSSPAANLTSRLRWVENAFKPNETSGQQAATPQNNNPPAAQQAAQGAQGQKAPIAGAGEFKAAVILMRKRMQEIHDQMVVLDNELSEIEKKMN